MKTTKETLLLKLGELQQMLLSDGSNASITDEEPSTLSENWLLLFTEKEIMKMPKNVRKQFRVQGKSVHYRKRTDGRYNCSYEIRYAKKPFNNPPISVSATSLEELKARFIEKLNSYVPQDDTAPTVPKDFDGFAMYWFENFHKRKVCAETYKLNTALYKRHIQAKFNKTRIDNITPMELQKLLDEFADKGKTREDIYSLLNQIFDSAVKHGLVKLNPLGMVFKEKHNREHGKAISKKDEIKLLSFYKGSQYELSIAIALYTGLRPNEYSTATIDGWFIRAVNSKRHNANGKVEYKRIPISPMLKPYLNGVKEIKMFSCYTLTRKFKEVLPQHKLYDMRTTFQTRCTECGVSDVAIGIFMGNSIGGSLKEAYTDVSDEYLIKEAQKIKY